MSKFFPDPPRDEWEWLHVFDFDGKKLGPPKSSSKSNDFFGKNVQGKGFFDPVKPNFLDNAWYALPDESDPINWVAGDGDNPPVPPPNEIEGMVWCCVPMNIPFFGWSWNCIPFREGAQGGLDCHATRDQCMAACPPGDDGGGGGAGPAPPHVSPPVEDDDITTMSDVCIETIGRKRIEIDCEIAVKREAEEDIGTEEHPDPQQPDGKAFLVTLFIYTVKWIKESERDCLSIAEFVQDGFEQLRVHQNRARVQAYPVLGNTDSEARQYGYFLYPRYNSPSTPVYEAAIGYDIHFEVNAGPTNCNIPCLNFEGENDDLAFYDFCGGSKKELGFENSSMRKDVIMYLPWTRGGSGNEGYDAYDLAKSLGLLNDSIGGYISPPGWIDHLFDNESTFMTYKDSILLQSLFNLEGTSSQKNPWPDLAEDILEVIHRVDPVDYCVPEYMPLDWGDAGAANTRHELVKDEWFTLKPFNSVYNYINMFAHERQ